MRFALIDRIVEVSAGKSLRAYRNLVRAGEWYNVWVMCWKNGQRSPVHDHAASGCVVRVLKGTLTETRYEFAPNGAIKAVGSRELKAGEYAFPSGTSLARVLAAIRAGAVVRRTVTIPEGVKSVFMAPTDYSPTR